MFEQWFRAGVSCCLKHKSREIVLDTLESANICLWSAVQKWVAIIESRSDEGEGMGIVVGIVSTTVGTLYTGWNIRLWEIFLVCELSSWIFWLPLAAHNIENSFINWIPGPWKHESGHLNLLPRYHRSWDTLEGGNFIPWPFQGDKKVKDKLDKLLDIKKFLALKKIWNNILTSILRQDEKCWFSQKMKLLNTWSIKIEL